MLVCQICSLILQLTFMHVLLALSLCSSLQIRRGKINLAFSTKNLQFATPLNFPSCSSCCLIQTLATFVPSSSRCWANLPTSYTQFLSLWLAFVGTTTVNLVCFSKIFVHAVFHESPWAGLLRMIYMVAYNAYAASGSDA